MEQKEILQKESGLTLLEVLLSILILTVILVSMMNFFPQMGKMNTQNKEKLETVNLTKKVLNKWQENDDIKLFLQNPNAISIPEFKGETNDNNQFLFETTIKNYKIQVLVNKDSDLNSGPAKPHAMRIVFFDDKDSKVTETYGYIVVNESEAKEQ